MQATDLGRYLFYGHGRGLPGGRRATASRPPAEPSDDSDWTVDERRRRVHDRQRASPTSALAVGGGGRCRRRAGSGGDAGRSSSSPPTGCPEYPEVDVNVTGRPDHRLAAYGEVTGLLDGHMHGMAYEFLGGKAHCGKPWDRFGAPYALRDCVDHEVGGGCGAVLENVLYGNPARCHDPVGWPTFDELARPQVADPRADLLALARARLARRPARVREPVRREPGPLRALSAEAELPATRWTASCCRRAASARCRTTSTRSSAGPARACSGSSRNPFEARKVDQRGQARGGLGMEVSEPFDCGLTSTGSRPATRRRSTSGSTSSMSSGVPQLEIANKFDNALTGVAGDSGTTGAITNVGQLPTPPAASGAWSTATTRRTTTTRRDRGRTPTTTT